jgi:uncharacterized protein (DUF1697 family)
MALVVLLKGVNVGGHRRFRPSVLAHALRRFDVVNVGAAGTFVVRKPISPATLRAEIQRRLPFEAEVMICQARDVQRLVSATPFAGHRTGPAIVQFVSVLAKRRGPFDIAQGRPFDGAQGKPPSLPLQIPARGEWCVKVLACDGRFVLGLYRRQMKAIGYLSQLEKVFGVPVTTRSWTTFVAIARLLGK